MKNKPIFEDDEIVIFKPIKEIHERYKRLFEKRGCNSL